MKTIDDYFFDWQARVFGYGYGTGEEPVFSALKQFLAAIPPEGCYDYRMIEDRIMSAPITWLLINTLAHAHLIEYGTSPRFGWLTTNGKALKTYMSAKTLEELVEVASRDENYTSCCPASCCCDQGNCKEDNPFWASASLT